MKTYIIMLLAVFLGIGGLRAQESSEETDYLRMASDSLFYYSGCVNMLVDIQSHLTPDDLEYFWNPIEVKYKLWVGAKKIQEAILEAETEYIEIHKLIQERKKHDLDEVPEAEKKQYANEIKRLYEMEEVILGANSKWEDIKRQLGIL